MTFLLLVGIIILLIWIANLSGRVERVEKQLRAGGAPVPRPGLDKAAQPEPYEKPATAQPLFSHPTHNVAAETEIPLHVNVPVPPAIPQEPVKPKQTDLEVETKLATNWASKIGVIAILLGLAFFFKYAVDQGWITEWTRIIIGFIVGALFVSLGWLWRNKYDKYADVIMGGGIAIWFFAVYAAYDFYHLFPQSVALALMVLFSITSVWLARLRNSQVLALLGLFGAYGAPVLLSSGLNRQVLLFVYLTVLNIAVFTVLAKNYWMKLLYFAFTATVVDYAFWAGNFSSVTNAPTSALFWIVAAAMFLIIPAALYYRHVKISQTSLAESQGLPPFVVTVSVIFTIICAMLLHGSLRSLLVVAMLVGAVSAYLSFVLVDRLEHKGVNYAYSFMGAGMFLLALTWHFDGRALALSLILTGLFAAVVAALTKREEIRTVGFIVLLLAMFSVLYQGYGNEKPQFLYNAQFGLMLFEVAALFFASWLYRFFPESPSEKHGAAALRMISVVLLWVACTWDITRSFSGFDSRYFMALWWVLYPLMLAFLSRTTAFKTQLWLVMILTIAGFFNALTVPYSPAVHTFLFNPKFGLIALETLSLLMTAWFIAGAKSSTPSDGYNTEDIAKVSYGLKIISVLLLWIGLTWDITKVFSGFQSKQLMGLLWVLYPLVLVYVRKVTDFKVPNWIIIGLTALGFLDVLVMPYDMSTYTFIFNAKFGLMMLEAVSLFITARWIEADSSITNKNTDFADMFKTVASLLVWFAFSWELTKYFAGTNSTNTRNLSLSVWWIVYATILIIIGAVRKSALLRKVAIALFLLSILKVFLYDVQTLETVYRIVSFIVLGIILLSVSFGYQRNKEKIAQFIEG